MLLFLLAAGVIPDEAPAAPEVVWVRRGLGPAGWTLPLRVDEGRVGVGGVAGTQWLDLATGALAEADSERLADPTTAELPWAPGLLGVRVAVDHPTIDAIVSLPDGVVVALDEDRAATGTWTIRGTVRIHDETGTLPTVGAGLVLHVGGHQVTTGADGSFELKVPAGRPLQLSIPDGPQSGLGCALQSTLAYGGDQDLALVWFCPAPC